MVVGTNLFFDGNCLASWHESVSDFIRDLSKEMWINFSEKEGNMKMGSFFF